MIGVHDLGGRQGFGPVPVDDDWIFADDWERRAFALTQLAQGLSGFNTDAFRHGIEREDPTEYLTAPYFEKWIRNGERMLVEGGVLAADAVSAHLAGKPAVSTPRRTTAARPPSGRGAQRTPDAPARFVVGDRVRAVGVPAGDTSSPPTPTGPTPTGPTPTGPGRHTRLPAYIAGKTGTIVLCSGVWVFPDTHAHGLGEQPTWVYAVAFDSRDLWPDDPANGGSSSPASHMVHIDLFETYLEPAQ